MLVIGRAPGAARRIPWRVVYTVAMHVCVPLQLNGVLCAVYGAALSAVCEGCSRIVESESRAGVVPSAHGVSGERHRRD